MTLCMGIDQLEVLKEILTQKAKTDLLQKVVELEERRNQEDEFEWRKGTIKISFLRPFSQWVFPYVPL